MATNAEKHPEIWAAFQKVRARRDAIDKAHEPLRKKREDISKKIDVLREQDAEVVDKLKADREELNEIDAELSRLALAMGGARLSD